MAQSFPTNEDRAEWAAQAIGAFVIANGGSDTPDDDLADLLCDLMHMAKRDGQDFDRLMGRARSNFFAELDEANEPFDVTEAAYMAAARDKWASDDIEIDANPIVSVGEEGAFVSAWVHVTHEDAGVSVEEGGAS